MRPKQAWADGLAKECLTGKLEVDPAWPRSGGHVAEAVGFFVKQAACLHLGTQEGHGVSQDSAVGCVQCSEPAANQQVGV